MTSFEVEGRNIPKGELPNSHVRLVGLDYFSVMRIPLLAGRAFAERDNAQASGVAIVNETFAKRHFPNENPLGKHIKPGISAQGEPVWREIVGVVKDVKHRQSLGDDYEPEYYLPHAQVQAGMMSLILRTTNEPRSLAGALQQTVHDLDKDIPVSQIRTLDH